MRGEMRVGALLAVLLLASGLRSCERVLPDTVAPAAPVAGAHTPAPSPTPQVTPSPAPQAAPGPAPPRVDFATQIRPILETRCTPCHFPGGKMYQRLPFDRPETLHALGDKLFTRIKDEREQQLFRAFLTQPRDLSPTRPEPQPDN
ncbi:MAG TPA: hypothetical protein VF546_13275 [Pyrinomonadaceae bacterium]|jgi:hypothetical protein